MNLLKIWKERGKILEGIKANIFHDDHIEEIARERQTICLTCPKLDTVGTYCAFPGAQPCCKECGCKLAYKTRSLSSECPLGYWKAELSEQEDDALTDALKYQP